MLYRRKAESSVQVELSPLIDVVFLLLIFFMVSTRFKDDHGLDLSLPGSESKQASKNENLTVFIDKDLKIKVGDEIVPLAQLKEHILRRLPNYQSKMVVLKVDQAVSHGIVVEAMDAAKKAGAEGLTFATTAKQKPPQNRE